MLQGSLITLGYKLPFSLKSGKADGIYGNETFGAVKSYQDDNKLGSVDGVAGRQTWGALDAQMVALKQKKPPKPTPPKPQPPVMTPEYMLGTADPTYTPDPGSGPWDSQPLEITYVALKEAILKILPVASVKLGDDAAKHMRHFFRNTGSDYTMDLEGMIAELPTARSRLESEVSQAKEFVEKLPPGTHQITSRKLNGAYARKSESTNWYYAIGGFLTWGKGTATVSNGPSGRSYTLEFEFKFIDRYNWDGGKQVTIDVPGLGPVVVTDAFMQQFHRQGLAQEFTCKASVRRSLRWNQGDPIPPAQLEPGGGR